MFSYSAIICPPLTVPPNGLITYSPDVNPPFDYQTVANYVCNTGFALSGGTTGSPAVCEDVNGGEWIGDQFTCERE